MTQLALRQECAVDGCAVEEQARGLCSRHYSAARWQRTPERHVKYSAWAPVETGDQK